MTCYIIRVNNVVDEFDSAEVESVCQNLKDTLQDAIIDCADLTYFSIMMISLIENIEVKTVTISKSDDDVDYNISIEYQEDFYKTIITLERTEDDLKSSMLGDIQRGLMEARLANVIGVQYQNGDKSEESEDENEK
jgi:hypothetical protein